MTEELKKVIARLQQHIKVVPSNFLKYSETELRRKPAPNKWSKKELLGHLTDSAANKKLFKQILWLNNFTDKMREGKMELQKRDLAFGLLALDYLTITIDYKLRT